MLETRNPEALRLAQEIVGRIQAGPGAEISEPASFIGVYMSTSSRLFRGLVATARDIALATNNRKNAQAFGKMLAAIDQATADGDLTIVANMPQLPDLSRYARQEELSHRNNTRSGARQMFGQMANRPVIRRVRGRLGEGYEGISDVNATDEVTAKSFRDDAETELRITKEQKYDIWTELIDALDSNDILDAYIRDLPSVSPGAKEFTEYARDQRGQRNQPDVTARTGETDYPTGSEAPVRTGGTESGRRTRPVDDDDKFARLRQASLRTAGRRAGGKELDAGRERRYNNLPAALADRTLARESGVTGGPLRDRERAYIAKHTRGNAELARDLTNDVVFARPVNWARVRVNGKEYNLNDRATRVKDVALDILSTPRAVKSSSDLSAPFRQGLVTAVNHPVLATRSFIKQLTMLPPKIGAAKYEAFKQNLFIHPYIELAEASDLHLTSLGDDLDLSAREEAFMSRLLGNDRYFANQTLDMLHLYDILHCIAHSCYHTEPGSRVWIRDL